jgi:carboxyl-terminal processing protease
VTTKRGHGRRLIAAALVLITVAAGGLVGCSFQDLPLVGGPEPRTPGEFSNGAARQVFNTAFESIDRLYIDPVPLPTVALHGMQALSSLDPEFRVERIGADIRISGGAKPPETYQAPSDHDSSGWASVIAGTLESGRVRSEKLRVATVENLYQAVFDGSLHDLDKFSRYAGTSAAGENRAARDGFGGIGAEVKLIDEQARIGNVIADTPAASGGLRSGDVITHVDGMPIAGIAERAIISMIRGPEGTEVKLTVQRDKTPPFVIALRRAMIIAPTVTYRREAGDVAYFHVTGFNSHTTETLRAFVIRAKGEIGTKLKGVVLDLRNNPGGLLHQGVEVADLFINAGRILTTRGRHPESLQAFDARDGDILNGLPMVVLINGGSASSAEIVAAALQDLDRAVLIGSSSYGKGTVQTLVRMPNDGELTLTWAKLYSPSGYALQRLGVVPNLCTSGKAVNAKRTIDDVRQGRLDLVAPVTARRSAEGQNEIAQLAFAQTCPTKTGAQANASSDDPDLEIARAMLADPAVIRRWPRGSSIAVAR